MLLIWCLFYGMTFLKTLMTASVSFLISSKSTENWSFLITKTPYEATTYKVNLMNEDELETLERYLQLYATLQMGSFNTKENIGRFFAV